MKGYLVNIRPFAGLFLEALMLVFVFAYSQGDWMQQIERKETPAKGVASLQEILLRNTPPSQALHPILSLQHVATASFPQPANDLASKALALNKALDVVQFERNVFYVNDAFNAP